MSELSYFDEDQGEIRIENPNAIQLVETIKLLGERKHTCFHIESASGILTIARCKRNRYRVHFYSLDKQGKEKWWGSITDRAYQNDKMTVPYYDYNGEKDQIAIYETISLDKALEISLYFGKHDSFPIGLTWSGKTNANS